MNGFIDRAASNRRRAGHNVGVVVIPFSFIDNVTVFSRAASCVRRQFSLFEILPVACLVPESGWAPGESHRGINRLSSAKAEIGFGFRMGKLRVSH